MSQTNSERLAEAVSFLRQGKVLEPKSEIGWKGLLTNIEQVVDELMNLGELVVVDIQAIYNTITETESFLVTPYDMNARPPWKVSILGYTNHQGITAVVLNSTTTEIHPWSTVENDVKWDSVKWITNGIIFMHIDRGRRLPPPFFHISIAIYESGEIADIHWTQLDERVTITKADTMLAAWLYTTNLLNCRNVTLLPSHLVKEDRAARRRIQRLGVRLHTLHVTPSGSYRRTGSSPFQEITGSMPLHSVRGHTKIYGMEGRKLLFGKYAGRFFVPSHVRGLKTNGEVHKKFVIETEEDELWPSIQ